MNVSPRDLAIVVGCWDERFNGATCVVLGASQSIPHELLCNGHYWEVRFARPMRWNISSTGVAQCVGNFPDMWLRKLSGPGVVLDVQCESAIVEEASG